MMSLYQALSDCRKSIRFGHANPAIGLELCIEKSEAVVKCSILAGQKQLFAAKYLPYLPTEEELKRKLERERAQALEQLKKKELEDE